MTLHLGAFNLYEFDVGATDLVLCLVAGWLAVNAAKAAPSERSWAVRAFFGSLAASSLLGALFHFFFPEKAATAGGFALWMLVCCLIGLTAVCLWYIAALELGPPAKRWIGRLLPIAFLAYLITLLFIDYTFRTVVAFYLPALLVFMALALARTIRRTRGWGLLLAGCLLTLLAACVQQLKIGIDSTYFNFNATYHLIQAVALLAFGSGFSRAPWEGVTSAVTP